MCQKLLLKFHKTTKSLPHRIIFYRDGVSEGQFKEVLQYEARAFIYVNVSYMEGLGVCVHVCVCIIQATDLPIQHPNTPTHHHDEQKLQQVPAIKAACTRINPQYNPLLTFVVVQKRHNTRYVHNYMLVHSCLCLCIYVSVPSLYIHVHG